MQDLNRFLVGQGRRGFISYAIRSTTANGEVTPRMQIPVWKYEENRTPVSLSSSQGYCCFRLGNLHITINYILIMYYYMSRRPKIKKSRLKLLAHWMRNVPLFPAWLGPVRQSDALTDLPN
jgi:hypothetical protein